MAANRAAWVAFLCGLLIPGMGQFMLGRKKRGLCFFLPANIILISALTVIVALVYKAGQIAPNANMVGQLRQSLLVDNLGLLLALGIVYVLLLLAAALDAFRLARKNSNNQK